MESHVKLLGVLHLVLGSLGVLAAIVIAAIFGGAAAMMYMNDRGGSATAAPFVGGLAGFVAIVLLGISLPGVIGGIGLLRMAPWSRVLVIIVSVLDLFHFPFGTALGIYGLWALTKPETQALFDQRRYRAASY